MNYTSKLISILSVFLASAFIMSCNKQTSEEAAPTGQHSEEENTVEFTAAQYKTAGIELGKVETKQISGTIRVNGVLDAPPQQMMSISVPLGGFLKSTSLLQGSRVTKGQVIATI